MTLVKRSRTPRKTLLASSQGNTLSLPGGNWLMGYGGLPNFTEYDSSGHVLLDGTLGKNVQDFRTYLSPWSGQPTRPPSLAAQSRRRRDARRCRELERRHRGRLLARARGRLAAARSRPWRRAAQAGFRDDDHGVDAPGPYVAVQALDAAGDVIGTSATVKA